MVRTQLTLFVPRDAAGMHDALEALRAMLDPVQHRLIAAHVTLCREQELAALAPGVLGSRLADGAERAARALTLAFGRAESFDGHGVQLGCTGGLAEFAALRRHVLGGSLAREQRPHLTLAHPRNPRAPGNVPGFSPGLPDPLVVTFRSATLIEQRDGGVWQVIREYPLGAA